MQSNPKSRKRTDIGAIHYFPEHVHEPVGPGRDNIGKTIKYLKLTKRHNIIYFHYTYVPNVMRNTLNYVRSYRINRALLIINNLCVCCLIKKKILNISHVAIRQRNWQTPKCCVVRLGFDRIDDGKKSIALFQPSFTILHGRPAQKTIRRKRRRNRLEFFSQSKASARQSIATFQRTDGP